MANARNLVLPTAAPNKHRPSVRELLGPCATSEFLGPNGNYGIRCAEWKIKLKHRRTNCTLKGVFQKCKTTCRSICSQNTSSLWHGSFCIHILIHYIIVAVLSYSNVVIWVIYVYWRLNFCLCCIKNQINKNTYFEYGQIALYAYQTPSDCAWGAPVVFQRPPHTTRSRLSFR